MHKIKVRGVIMMDNKVFLVREIKKHFYYLPGGTLEGGESLKGCLKRELKEELGVEPVVGNVLNMTEFENSDGKLCLDYWFQIDNPEDFLETDRENSTHGFEIYEEGFYSLDDLEGKDLRPGDINKVLGKKMNISII